MRHFKIKRNGYAELSRTGSSKVATLLLFMLGWIFAIFYFQNDESADTPTVWPYVLAIMVLAVGIGLYKGKKRQKYIWESYQITFDDASITRTQYNTPTITIAKGGVAKITKNVNGSFTLVGRSSTDIIGIPAQMEAYEALEQQLSEIMPISIQNSEPFLVKYLVLISALLMSLMGAVYFSTNKIIVATAGFILLAFLGYSIFEIRRNKNIDENTRKSSWLFWVVMFSIVVNVLYKVCF